MQFFRKQFALVAALTLLSTGTAGGFPEQVFRKTAAQESISVLDFAEKLSAQKAQRSTDQDFTELRFSKRKQQITCDGRASGQKAGGFCVVDGELKMEAELPADGVRQGAGVQNVQQYISLADAKKAIGCEVEEKDGEIIVRSPFQSARLLVTAEGKVDSRGAVSVTEGYRDLHVFQYNTAAEAYTAYQALKNDPAVRLVEPDRMIQAAEATEEDKKYIGPTERWGIDAIGADSYRDWLRSVKTDLPEIRVAVIDTGLYEDHAWMKGRVAPNGAAFVEGTDASYNDENGHGTHCAGIIVSSTLENVKILPVRVLNAFGGGTLLQIYLGMMYALEQGVDAASMSLGAFGESGYFNEAVQKFAEAGIPLAIAAGNETMDAKYATPAMCPSAFTVSAVERDPDHAGSYRLADFSNFGKGIDFSAPGVDIVSSINQGVNSTEEMSGTSMATPYVAACIADLLSYDPELTNEQIYNYLKANATDLGEPGFDESYGWGMVNLKNFRFSEKMTAAPSFSVSAESDTEGDRYSTPVTVTLKTEDTAAKIYYTVDGTDPTVESGTLYQGEKIKVDRSMTIRAIAVEDGIPSSVVSKVFQSALVVTDLEYNGYADFEQTADGEQKVLMLEGAQHVTLPKDTFSTDNVIYYTLDGSEPTPTHGLKTTVGKGIYLDESVTLKLRWQDSDGMLSDVADFKVKVTASAPAFYLENGVLTMEAGLNAEAIYYTLDGSDPVPGKSTRYSTGLLLDKTTHVRAIAVSGKAVSEIADYAMIVGGKDIADAIKVEDGVLVSYSGIMSELDLSKESFTSVGKEAFKGNVFLETVTLPASCTKLGDYAFAELPRLETVKGGAVTAIGEGTFMKCWGLVNLDAALTEIPAKAFWSSNMPLKNAKIKKIGDYAFYANAEALYKKDAIVWEEVESIGDYAFADEQDRPEYFYERGWIEVQGELNLKALKSLGKHAFDGNMNLSRLILPDSITELPEGTLRNACSLREFRAAGLTVLGDEAMAFTPMNPNGIAVDWSKLTALGKKCFQNFVFGSDAEFTALTEIGDDSFGNSDCRRLLFPAVKTLKTGSFVTPLYAIAIYFEHAETIEKNAFAFPISYEDDDAYWRNMGTVRYIVFGDALKTVDPSGIPRESMYTIGNLAAPAGSLLHTLYENYPRSETPSLDIVCDTEILNHEYVYTRNMPQFGTCELYAIPLGFDIDLQWYEIDESRGGLVNNGTLIKGETNNTLVVYGKEAGLKNYAAYIVKDGAIGRFSGTKSVRVVPLESAGTLDVNKNTVLDFSDTETMDGVSYLCYAFTPEADGTYYFERAYNNELSISDADGKNVPAEQVAYGRFAAELKGGKTYRIIFSNWMSNMLDSVCVESAETFGTLKDIALGEAESVPEQIYNGTAPAPAIHMLYDVAYNYDPSTGDWVRTAGSELEEGKDFEVRYENHPVDGYGLAYVTGINGYKGILTVQYSIALHTDYYRALTGLFLNKPVTVKGSSETQEFVFCPSATGSYNLQMFYNEEQLKEVFRDNTYWVDSAEMNVYNVTGGKRELEYADDFYFNGLGLPMMLSIPLKKNNWYVVEITPDYVDPERGRMVDASLELSKANDENSLWNAYTDESFSMNSFYYTGEPIEPDLMLRNWMDEPMIKGQDYTVSFFHNVETGTMAAVATGINGYKGQALYTAEIRYDNWNNLGNVQTLRLGKPVTVKDGYQSYYFELKEDSYVSMTLTGEASFKGMLQNQESFFGEEYWNNYLAFDQTSFNSKTLDEHGNAHEGRFLPAGKYFMAISHSTGEYQLQLDIGDKVPDLNNAVIEIEDCLYTGEAVKPAITVLYNGKKLTEGTDYEVRYPEDMINCGAHLITLNGMGEYVGTVQYSMNILPVQSLANGHVLKEGTTAAKITKEARVIYYAWTPDKSEYTIASDEIMDKSIRVYEPDAAGRYYITYSVEGLGYQAYQLKVTPGKTYLVTASFVSENIERDLSFTLRSGGRLIEECALDGPEVVQVKSSIEPVNELPEYRILDGDKVLEKGKDYIEIFHEGNTEFGRARILVQGIGSYIGEMTYDYLIAPREPVDIVKSLEREEIKLYLDEAAYYEPICPGYGYCSRFTAPADGTYYLTLPEAGINDASAFVFDSKLNLLPADTKKVTLKKGDWIAIASVTTYAEPETNLMFGYEIAVTSEPGEHYITMNGITYLAGKDGCMIVNIDTNSEFGGIMLPESVYDEAYGGQVTVRSLDEDMYEALGRPVLFCTKDTSAYESIRDNYFYKVVLIDSKSKLKGDVSGDGLIDDNDADILQRYLTELNGMELPAFAYANADMNGDGSVDILDVSAILGYVAENANG